jgi:hypothetical protein
MFAMVAQKISETVLTAARDQRCMALSLVLVCSRPSLRIYHRLMSNIPSASGQMSVRNVS